MSTLPAEPPTSTAARPTAPGRPVLPPPLLTVNQLARYLGVASRTIWRWEAQGRIPRGLRLTRNTVRWPADTLETLLAKPA